MALGFTGMSMLGIQFLLTARFRRACAPFGIDIIYLFHRYLAIMVVFLIALHYFIIRITNIDALGIMNPLQAPWYMTAGRTSFLMLLVLIVTSLWRKSLRTHYDEWRIAHIGLSVACVLFALAHIEGVGYYIDVPAKRWIWTGYVLFWLSLVVYVRLLKPWQVRRKPYRVLQVIQECCNCWALVFEPYGDKGISF